MKTKMLKTKKLTKPTQINIEKDCEDKHGALGLFLKLGYRVYEDPVDPDFVAIVSPRPLTYGYYKRYLLPTLECDLLWEDEKDYQLDWWNGETNYNSRLNEELPLYFE